MFMLPHPTIVPSLSSCPAESLEDNLTRLLTHGVKFFHVDCMDGKFVPEVSDGIALLKRLGDILSSSDAAIDVHLLVEDPLLYIEELAGLRVARISVHAESNIYLPQASSILRNHNILAGLAILPRTEPDLTLLKSGMFSFAHVVTAEGGKFVEAIVERVHSLSDALTSNVGITADGGIGERQVLDLAKAGTQFIVIGSGIFSAVDPVNQFVRLSTLTTH